MEVRSAHPIRYPRIYSCVIQELVERIKNYKEFSHHAHSSLCNLPFSICSSNIQTQYDYLRWLYLTPESACKRGPTHVPGAIAKCAAIGIPINGSHHDHHDSRRYTRHKKISVEGPLVFCHMWPGKNVPMNHLFSTASTIVIGIRDPFVRAISGFRSKFEQDCENNEQCFQSTWVKKTDTQQSTVETHPPTHYSGAHLHFYHD